MTDLATTIGDEPSPEPARARPRPPRRSLPPNLNAALRCAVFYKLLKTRLKTADLPSSTYFERFQRDGRDLAL